MQRPLIVGALTAIVWLSGVVGNATPLRNIDYQGNFSVSEPGVASCADLFPSDLYQVSSFITGPGRTTSVLKFVAADPAGIPSLFSDIVLVGRIGWSDVYYEKQWTTESQHVELIAAGYLEPNALYVEIEVSMWPVGGSEADRCVTKGEYFGQRR